LRADERNILSAGAMKKSWDYIIFCHTLGEAKCENEDSKLTVAMSSRMHETENCRIARRNESAALNITCASTTGAIPEGKFRCIRLTPNRLVSEALNILYLQTVFCAETDLRSQKKTKKEKESRRPPNRFRILSRVPNSKFWKRFLIHWSSKITYW